MNEEDFTGNIRSAFFCGCGKLIRPKQDSRYQLQKIRNFANYLPYYDVAHSIIKDMKAIVLGSLLASITTTAIQAAPASPPPKVRTIQVPVHPRTIQSLPNFPLATLKTSLSAKLYKSLSVSNLDAWIVATVPPYGGAPKITHSEAGGVLDKLALSMAKEWSSVAYNTTESRTHAPSLTVHLLIYKIADGLMAVNFANNDEAFYAGRKYTDVWVGIWKDNKWTRVGGTKVIRQSVEPYR